jgi:hypothetical protein
MSPIIVVMKPEPSSRKETADAAAVDEFYRRHAEPFPSWIVVAFRLVRFVLAGFVVFMQRSHDRLRNAISGVS